MRAYEYSTIEHSKDSVSYKEWHDNMNVFLVLYFIYIGAAYLREFFLAERAAICQTNLATSGLAQSLAAVAANHNSLCMAEDSGDCQATLALHVLFKRERKERRWAGGGWVGGGRLKYKRGKKGNKQERRGEKKSRDFTHANLLDLFPPEAWNPLSPTTHTHTLSLSREQRFCTLKREE